MITEDVIQRAVALRRRLHRQPELSGRERQTAERIARFVAPLRPDLVLRGLGGHGLAVVFTGPEPGPTVMLRCELDALPIREAGAAGHRSAADGCMHACGHDGHMAILAAVGGGLARTRPRRGRAVLLFQPAEETGRGAAAVLADPRFPDIAPDLVFALHNLPGYPLGRIVLRSGSMCCASTGMVISLHGVTAHAAQPETGRSPATVVARLIDLLHRLPDRLGLDPALSFATVVGARLGADEAFGTAPGEARVLATLRSDRDETLQRMAAFVATSARRLARRHGLGYEIERRDEFAATVNASRAVGLVRRAAGAARTSVPRRPFPWSEDFGQFTAIAPGALVGLGAGERAAALHDPAYDFPDELVPLGADLLSRLVRLSLE
jgi:amidohydrolase